MKIISLRGGYETNNDVLSWSGGLGLGTNMAGTRVDIDYSYSHTNFFGGVNRFGLRVGF